MFDNTILEGLWDNDLLNGQGKIISLIEIVRAVYPNGDQFTGNFASDQRNGYGTYIYGNGAKFDGEFRDDRKF